MKLLGKNHVGKTRPDALERRSYKKEIECSQDNADMLVEEFSAGIQSNDCFGNNYLSIKGIALEYHKNIIT